MKALRSWIPAALAAVLAACGDGGIQSPDFTPVVSITNLRIQPLDPQQGTQIPVGTTLPFQAIATFEQTVPPGTEGAQNGVVVRDEDVTGIADWQSQNSGFATVDSGIVRGVSPSGGQVRITAAYEGLVAQTFVTITEAVLVGVDHVRPRAATARDPADRYTAAAGSAVPFEIFGEFRINGFQQQHQIPADKASTHLAMGLPQSPELFRQRAALSPKPHIKTEGGRCPEAVVADLAVD